MTIRVVVMDPSARLRGVCKDALRTLPGVEIVGSVQNMEQLSLRLASSAPSVLVTTMRALKEPSKIVKLKSEHGVGVVLQCIVGENLHTVGSVATKLGASAVLPPVSPEALAGDYRVVLLQGLHAADQVSRTCPVKGGRLEEAPLPSTRGQHSLIAIGASTGGVEAASEVLRMFPVSAPPTLLVQHISAKFSESLAGALDQVTACHVKLAEDGDFLRPGLILLSPGDRHMTVKRQNRQLAVAIDSGPKVNQHRPSVDRLFQSVAVCGIQHATGILLTGMGRDGASGLLAMKQAGYRTMAQDEATCVVYGMPKAAIESGAAEVCLPLGKIAANALRPKS